MSRPLRVVHLPARTPYVRKIVSPDFAVLNGATTEHGVVPTAVTADWVLDWRPLDWFDVLHLHHVEFEKLPVLERLLTACAESSIRVVITAHDIAPMLGTAEDFRARLELLAQSPAAWVGLTAASIDALRDQVPGLPPVSLIPHGYVVRPDDAAGKVRQGPPAPAYLLYGALRPNRDHLSTITNWSLAITHLPARLHLLLRAFSPSDFSRHDVPALLAIIRSDPRIVATMRAYPSDQEVIAAGLQADALLLPYLFGSHSGQLELAFDLNLLPVCSSVGYLKDQYQMHKGLVSEPIWFDWSEGHPGLFGEKFVAALDAAQLRLNHATGRRNVNNDFLEYRREEHDRFLSAHHALYAS